MTSTDTLHCPAVAAAGSDYVYFEQEITNQRQYTWTVDKEFEIATCVVVKFKLDSRFKFQEFESQIKSN